MASTQTLVGWREVLALPGLGLESIKAKIDTGARTSCLHAFSVTEFTRDDEQWVRFGMHPKQSNSIDEQWCEAKVVDKRKVTDSGGHSEMRFVILSDVQLGGHRWPVELTLTDRDSMKFRMLLGRTALAGNYLVDSAASYLQSKKPEQ